MAMSVGSIRTPEDLHRGLVEAFGAGDVEAAVALYEPGATFMMQPGKPVTGQAQIRAALQMYLSMKPTLRIQTIGVVLAGDVALLSSSWTLTAGTPQGAPVTMSGAGAEVARRQADGTWRYAIDNPFAG